MKPAPAIVTGLAANTALGDAVTASAAARACLARPSGLDAMVLDEDEGPLPLMGHPVPEVGGFQGEARLLSLALPALRELVDEVAGAPGESVGFSLALPDLEARAKAVSMAAPPRLDLVELLVSLSGLDAPRALRQCHFDAHAGFARAVEGALQLLSQGRAGAVVVGGVETMCDDLAVEALAAEGRLKDADNPVGLMPGEAAAFLVLESPLHARRRHRPALGTVTGVGLGKEPKRGDAPPQGQGFLAVLRALQKETGAYRQGSTFFVLDRNGEAVRANDWGYALQRMAAKMPELASAPAWDPALSFGDTGAASGALGAVIAVRSFIREYAPGDCALVVSASDGGSRAAVRLERSV